MAGCRFPFEIQVKKSAQETKIFQEYEGYTTIGEGCIGHFQHTEI
jgi:hypothetical protein